MRGIYWGLLLRQDGGIGKSDSELSELDDMLDLFEGEERGELAFYRGGVY